MGKPYRENHYVPAWYQRRFMLAGETKYHHLYLHPREFTDPRGVRHELKSLEYQGANVSFVERDLYTRRFQGLTSVDIEKRFFGTIDTKGARAVEYFSNFDYPLKPWGNSLEDIIRYMSMQKLRTPKGLDWLKAQVGNVDKNRLLALMVRLRGIHGALWTECVWQIADASNSETKFIVSDHPVTVYNRRCGPKSDFCRGPEDPDIAYNGTHTIFPLSLNKVLILTNLSWVRNPYQSETSFRPNPNPMRSAIFKFTEVQVRRMLTEQEVREINFIIKSRAYKSIAAGKEEWLYPERHVSKSDWNRFGNGYLLMPDPRSVHLGGEIFWGGGPGGPGAMDEYGRVPGQRDYGKEGKSLIEGDTLYRFKGEFATLYGPRRRGRMMQVTEIEEEIDSEKFHDYHRGLWTKYKQRWKLKK